MMILLGFFALSAQERPSPPVNSQDGSSFLSSVNVVGFFGQWWLFKNLNNRGSWGGVYIDTKLFQSREARDIWSLGIYGMAAQSGFRSNLTRYSARTEEYGAGLMFGYYTNYSTKRAMFSGYSLGVKYSSDVGGSRSKTGTYRGVQNDLTLCFGVNFNIFKNPIPGDNLWRRTQLQLSLEKPLNTLRMTSWNGKEYVSDKWDREYIDALFKQSVVDYYWSARLVMTPKIIAGYSYSFGDHTNHFSVGTEVSLHKPMGDDYLSVYWMLKGNGRFDRNLSVIGLNINFALIF